MYRNDIDDNFFDIIPGKEYELFKLDAKGQLISKCCPFGVFKSPK